MLLGTRQVHKEVDNKRFVSRVLLSPSLAFHLLRAVTPALGKSHTNSHCSKIVRDLLLKICEKRTFFEFVMGVLSASL